MFIFAYQATLRTVAAERDFAISEMKEMAEQCQGIVEEFQLLADQHDQLQKEVIRVRHINLLCAWVLCVDAFNVYVLCTCMTLCMQVRTERDRAVKACESAYEASELLKTQLSLVSREKNLAQAHVKIDH